MTLPPGLHEHATRITEPGVYYDLAPEVYHAQHDWLSWSGMKNLIPPKTPAHFKATWGVRRPEKRAFDLGHVAHTLVLGEGDQYAVVQGKDGDATDFRTNVAKEHRDAIRADGLVPILRHELDAAIELADAVHAHPEAARLFAAGKPEVSLFWIDDETGVKCRARIDWLPEDPSTLVDFKTAVTAAPSEFAKSAAKLGYYGQAQHYSDGVRSLGVHDDPDFVFVVAEKDEPHLVSVGRFNDPDDRKLARNVVDYCRRVYDGCMTADHWPAYGDGTTDLLLPMWLHYDLADAGVAEQPASSRDVELKL